MFPFDLKDILNITVVLFLVGLPIWLTLLLRKILPDNYWLGLLLGLILVPFGHFYLKGGFIYMIFLTVFAFLLLLFTQNDVVLGITISLASLALMHLRFKVNFISKIELSS